MPWLSHQFSTLWTRLFCAHMKISQGFTNVFWLHVLGYTCLIHFCGFSFIFVDFIKPLFFWKLSGMVLLVWCKEWLHLLRKIKARKQLSFMHFLFWRVCVSSIFLTKYSLTTSKKFYWYQASYCIIYRVQIYGHLR